MIEKERKNNSTPPGEVAFCPDHYDHPDQGVGLLASDMAQIPTRSGTESLVRDPDATAVNNAAGGLLTISNSINNRPEKGQKATLMDNHHSTNDGHDGPTTPTDDMADSVQHITGDASWIKHMACTTGPDGPSGTSQEVGTPTEVVMRSVRFTLPPLTPSLPDEQSVFRSLLHTLQGVDAPAELVVPHITRPDASGNTEHASGLALILDIHHLEGRAINGICGFCSEFLTHVAAAKGMELHELRYPTISEGIAGLPCDGTLADEVRECLSELRQCRAEGFRQLTYATRYRLTIDGNLEAARVNLAGAPLPIEFTRVYVPFQPQSQSQSPGERKAK